MMDRAIDLSERLKLMIPSTWAGITLELGFKAAN